MGNTPLATEEKLFELLVFTEKHNWLFGEKWYKRALAFVGWTWLGALVIYAGIFAVAFVFGLLSAIFS